MNELLLTCTNQYKNLMEIKSNINTELDTIRDKLCFVFIQVQIELYADNPVPVHLIIDIVFNKYKDRFVQDNDRFSFTYGDVLHDQKFDSMCIVLHESNKYLTLWYFDNVPHTPIRRRMKDDSKLTVVVESVLNVNNSSS